MSVHVAEKPVRIVRKISSTTIKSSLWHAIEEAKMNTALALDLSEVYAWEIDFFGLKKKDSFKVVYDEMFVGSTSIGIAKIHAAVFNHMGKAYYAFAFKQDSIDSYWNENGQSLKKAFLKAPLKFSRITSGFSRSRLHPILKIFRPHYGIDYSAPIGTPVMTIGSGVVILKGYSGSAGNWIKIKHVANFVTSYMHLNRHVVDGARLHKWLAASGRDDVEVGIELLVEANYRVLFFLTDQKAHDGERGARAGSRV